MKFEKEKLTNKDDIQKALQALCDTFSSNEAITKITNSALPYNMIKSSLGNFTGVMGPEEGTYIFRDVSHNPIDEKEYIIQYTFAPRRVSLIDSPVTFTVKVP